MYAILGRPRDCSEPWDFCTNVKSVPEIFEDFDIALDEYLDWKASTSDWEYQIVEVDIIVKGVV